MPTQDDNDSVHIAELDDMSDQQKGTHCF